MGEAIEFEVTNDRLFQAYTADLNSVINSAWDRCLLLDLHPGHNTPEAP